MRIITLISIAITLLSIMMFANVASLRLWWSYALILTPLFYIILCVWAMTDFHGAEVAILLFVVLFPLSMVLFGSCGYIEHGIVHNYKLITPKDFEALYFSVVTWTTLGYGDFYPSEESRYISILLSILGYFHSGLTIALLIKLFTTWSNLRK